MHTAPPAQPRHWEGAVSPAESALGVSVETAALPLGVASGGRSHAPLDPTGSVWIQCHLRPAGPSACKDWGLLESWYPKPAAPNGLVLKVESTRRAVLGSGTALSEKVRLS